MPATLISETRYKNSSVLLREAVGQGTASQGLFLTLWMFWGIARCPPEGLGLGLVGPEAVAGV